MLAEQHRREGMYNFVQRTSQELGIPPQKISLWLSQYRNGTLEVDTVEWSQFSTYYTQAKTEAAGKSLQNTHKTLDAYNNLDLTVDHVAARNLSAAYWNMWRGTQAMVEGESKKSATQQTNVQIVYPPKEDKDEREEIKVVEKS